MSQTPGLPEGFRLLKPRSEQNFFERFGEDLKTRFGEQGAEIINARVASDQGFMSTALQLTGKVGAGTIMDFIGEVLVSGGRGLSNITPDAIEDPIKGGATFVATKLLDTELGQQGLEALLKGLDEWDAYRTEHPVMARNIESLVNVGLVMAPVRGKPRQPGVVGRAGEAAERSGVRAAVQNKRSFVDDLVTPQQNIKQRREQVARTTESGLLRQKQVALTRSQQESARFLMNLSVSPKRTLQGNYNVIRDAVGKETDALAKRLRNPGTTIVRNSNGKRVRASRGRYDPREYQRALDEAWDELRANPALVGDSEVAARRVFDIMRGLGGKETHVSNLLRSRKDFDNKIIREGRDKIFNPTTENGISLAVRSVRQATNRFIHERVPTVGVKNSLRKQSALLRAMDDIKPKAAKEGNNAITRSMQNVLKLLTLRGEINQIAATLLGMGGLGAAAFIAPFVLKGGLITAVSYGAGRLIMRPGARKALGKLLKLIDKATSRVTNVNALRQMRADRALIVEMIKELDRQQKEEQR